MRGAGRTRRRRERTVNARRRESRSLAPASHPPAAGGSVRSVVAPFTAARTLVLKCRTPHLARGAGGAFGFRSLERSGCTLMAPRPPLSLRFVFGPAARGRPSRTVCYLIRVAARRTALPPGRHARRSQIRLVCTHHERRAYPATPTLRPRHATGSAMRFPRLPC
jgi:hypothetical protein